MIKRRIKPFATWVRSKVTASRCQFGFNRTPGRTTPKANSVNAVRSFASSACRASRGLTSTPVISEVMLFTFRLFGLLRLRLACHRAARAGQVRGRRQRWPFPAFAAPRRLRGSPDGRRRACRLTTLLMSEDRHPAFRQNRKRHAARAGRPSQTEWKAALGRPPTWRSIAA